MILLKRHRRILAVIILSVFYSGYGCALAIDMKFPEMALSAPMVVSRVDVFPEEKICDVSDPKNVEKFVSYLSGTYPDGWRRTYVSLATTYRITIGKTEILLLRKGMAIVVHVADDKYVTYGRSYMEGTAENIVRSICPGTR